MQSWNSTPTNLRPQTVSSGFVTNSTLFDGHGWLPVKEMHGDNKNTIYRKSYNPRPPFHPQKQKFKERRLVKTKSNPVLE